VSEIVLQTPVPASGSEMLAGVAALIWFVTMFLVAHRFVRRWKHFGDIVSFLVYVIGLLCLVILLFQ
jgi:hypothetical protein